MARIITITSGKGGVGKTSISLNLALCLAAKKKKVCLFDADLGLANVGILTGIHPEADVSDVFYGNLPLSDIIIRNYQGIDIIPGSSGVEKLADLKPSQAQRLIASFLELDEYDFFIFDTSAGISAQVLAFCMASHEILLVITPEPTSLTDAYALVKVLSRNRYTSPVSVVVNQVKQASQAQKSYSKLNHTVNRFLSIKLNPLGVVAADTHVTSAVVSQIPFTLLFPDSRASKSIQALTRRLLDRDRDTADLPLELFWDKCLSFLNPQKHLLPRQSLPADEQASNRPEPEVNPASHVRTKDLTQKDLHAMLTAIENKVVTLLQELKEVKSLIVTPPPQKEPETVSNPRRQPLEIKLDFESWLARRS